MAERGRDLKIGVIAATDKFDLDKPARDLDELGDAAKDAGRDVKDSARDMAAGAKVAESAFEDLANEGSQSQRELSKFYDKMGADARKAGREVDSGMDQARKGVDTFKDEAKQSGRETAASFGGGFEDVVDFVQETAANAFADMGKVGAGAGIAIAAGLGFAVSKAIEFNERMSTLRQLFFDLGRDQATPGLTSLQNKLKKVAEELNPDQIKDVGDALKQTGFDADTFFKALAGDPGSLARARRELEGMIPAINAPWDKNANEAQHLLNVITNYERAARDGAEGSSLLTDVLTDTGVAAAEAGAAAETAAPQIGSLAESLKAAADAKHAENLAGITGGLRDVADASGEVATAVAEDGQVSISTLTKLLRDQTKAAKTHKTNVQKALREGGEEFAAWVSEQGAEVSQAYAAGSAKERGALRAAFSANVGSAMGDGITAGLNSKKPAASAAASRIHAEIKDRLDGTVNVPVSVSAPSAAAINSAANAVQRMMNARALRWRTEIADVQIP